MPLPRKIQIFKGQDGDPRVRMTFKNNRKLNVTEGYESITYARKVANDLGNALKIKVEDLTKKS